jgi:putative tryptophan/tyrosine transport system substrate-binding protein
MNRREVITLLLGGAAAATWPLFSHAQQAAMPVIGFLNAGSPEDHAVNVAAFLEGLKDAGYVERQNVLIEYRWAEGQYERVPALATDLVRRQVSVIVTPDSTLAAMAAKTATIAIPIVFRIGTDPVEVGLVASLNQPGGNLTGVTTLGVGLGPKRLELLHELIPAATSVALLVNPINSAVADAATRELQVAIGQLNLQLHVLRASTEPEIDAAFAKLAQLRSDGLIVATDAFFNSRSTQLATLSLRHAIPTIYQFREFTTAGGLMSYGGSVPDAYRLVGDYAGRILKGEKPATLPVQQSTKVELIVNLKTAKALGLAVPLSLLGRANEVIE